MKMKKGKIVCDVDRSQRDLMLADGWKVATDAEIAKAAKTGRSKNDDRDAGDRARDDAANEGGDDGEQDDTGEEGEGDDQNPLE